MGENDSTAADIFGLRKIFRESRPISTLRITAAPAFVFQIEALSPQCAGQDPFARRSFFTHRIEPLPPGACLHKTYWPVSAGLSHACPFDAITKADLRRIVPCRRLAPLEIFGSKSFRKAVQKGLWHDAWRVPAKSRTGLIVLSSLYRCNRNIVLDRLAILLRQSFLHKRGQAWLVEDRGLQTRGVRWH